MKYFALIFLSVVSMTIYAQSIPSYLPVNGLVEWLPFDSNANDGSGHNNNGTVYGATLTTDRFGIPNSAYDFNGTTDYIEVPDSKSLRFPNGTLSCWFKTTDSTARIQVLKKVAWSNAVAEQYGLVLFNPLGPDIDAKYNSNCNPGAGWFEVYPSYDSIYNNKWHFMVGTIDTDSVRIYIDGIELAAKAAPLTHMDTCAGSMLEIARNWSGDPIPYAGVLDDIALYNRALSKSEILQIYNGRPTGIKAIENPIQISIYPNPVNDIVQLNIPQNIAAYTVSVSNTLGQLLYQQDISNIKTLKIDMRTLPVGIYIIHVNCLNGQFTSKIIKE